jgi:hypothetical protein
VAKALNYSLYELMRKPVGVQRRGDNIAKFLESFYYVILICTTIFKVISWMSGGSGMATKAKDTSEAVACLCVIL